MLALLSGLSAGPAAAQQGNGAERQSFVNVVQVSGYLDPVLVDFLTDAIDASERDGAEALVVQLDSPGSVVSAEELDDLIDRVRTARVPIAVWVGESGAEALGGAARLVAAAPLAGMAPRSRLVDGTVEPALALVSGLVQLNEEESAVLGTFIAALDGREVAGATLETATFAPTPGIERDATLTVQARLAKLDVLPRLMHTVASPPVAYLLLSAALVLLVFELFTAGAGVAGGVGAVCAVLAGYGLAVLPTSPWGLALLVVGIFGFSVDVQTGVPRFWTAVGVIAYTLGSLLLFGDGIRLGWLPLVTGCVGVVLIMLAGLPATVRSRFSTPTVGRESMVGEMGEAVAEVAPDGVVRVREALWPARTNRATPVAAGGRVRVTGIDGPLLEVEPEVGAARDYRERRPKSGETADPSAD